MNVGENISFYIEKVFASLRQDLNTQVSDHVKVVDPAFFSMLYNNLNELYELSYDIHRIRNCLRNKYETF